MTLDTAALLSWMTASAAIGALVLKVGQWFVGLIRGQHQTDVEFGRALRDELWKEIARMRAEVEVVRERADECDQRALDCQAENVRLAERVSQLEQRG